MELTTGTNVTFISTGNVGTVEEVADQLTPYDGDLAPWAFVQFADGGAWVSQSNLAVVR